MSNSVRVSATFSFRGELLQPEMRLDLDEALEQGMTTESIYALLATKNNIDPYSYEYEMLEAEPLVFDEPEGLAEKYTENGRLDWKGLENAWKENRLLEKIGRIAKENMGIDNLEDIPGLKKTLLAVYSLAKE